jgi:hypothetical protein
LDVARSVNTGIPPVHQPDFATMAILTDFPPLNLKRALKDRKSVV